MSAESLHRRLPVVLVGACLLVLTAGSMQGRQMTPDLRDPKQPQDQTFAKFYKEWTGDAKYGSPLVDHLPIVKGIPAPKDVLGYHIGAPKKLTYYADILKYYRALAAATPRVKVETIGKSDEGREMVVVWVSSDANIKALAQNRDNLAKLADPRGLTDAQITQLIATTKPHYHVTGGLHSSESGPSEMLMELVYRVAVETSPFITQIRNNVYLSVTPVADADGRDRQVDWFYRGLEVADQITTPAGPSAATPAAAAKPAAPVAAATKPASAQAPAAGAAAADPGRAGQAGGRSGAASIGALPYWGKYVYHDNNRDINLSLIQMRALTEWYYTAHPPIMHDLHESMPLMYTYSGGPPQNPNLDPLLFAELPWFSNWELAQMTKWGMPGVYTHAFMDGWSPGYYASVAYNHNGLMKMYETQSGRDPGSAPAGRGGSGDAATGEVTAQAGRGGTAAAEGGRGGAQTPDAGRGPSTPRPGSEQASSGQAAGGRGPALPTGRGGAQDREWYRGLPVPPNAANSFTRRDNVNYSETGVLSSLQLTAMFPTTIIENFYVKSRNAIEDGRTKPPYGFVIPVQREMTKAAELVRILRVQGIEVGQATSEIKIGDATYPAGSYVIKRDQPYGRLAKNLLEKQQYPDTRLTTYDDSGWTMGLLMLVDVKEINDAAILKVTTTSVKAVSAKGRVAGTGSAGLAVAHLGSNNMIAFRYRLKTVPMRIAEKSFTAAGVDFPAGSFVISGAAAANVRAVVEELGLTAAALDAMPQVALHDAPAPRVAIYSQWTSTQDLGWYRLTFDNFGIPYDLIYKEQVKKGDLRAKYDVIVMAAQNINRSTVLQPAAARPQPYQKSDKYKFLGMYGETPDMSGGFGQEGVDAFAKFLDGGGTLIAAGAAIRFPIDFGWAHTIDAEPIAGVVAQRPIVQAEIGRPEHPVFYGYADKILPMKYVGGNTLRVGLADSGNILARYVGGDSSVLSGAMTGADVLRQKVIAADIPNAYNGKGRVILFANNPIYRWQNHGEFNMVFNALLNWAYVPPPAPIAVPASTGRGGRGVQ
ncbi:MAG: M14 family zinc carboxypeptidase [Acidobacteria bacterium]|nr:M14 family zinc carboxypeptidase [Acidobacteriota bacterium]